MAMNVNWTKIQQKNSFVTVEYLFVVCSILHVGVFFIRYLKSTSHPSYTDYGKDYGKSVTVHQYGGNPNIGEKWSWF